MSTETSVNEYSDFHFHKSDFPGSSKIKQLPYDPSIPLLSIYPRELNAAFLQHPKGGSNLDVCQQMNG